MTDASALEPLQNILAHPLIDRTRRNHGLEHATLNILAQTHPGVPLVGRSTAYGFYVYGPIGLEPLTDAAVAGLHGLNAGQAQLAIHANCGTNVVTAGIAAACAAYLGFVGADRWQKRWERLPIVALLTTLAILAAQPVALALQQHVTTSGQPRGLSITHVECRATHPVTVHFVKTAD